MDKSEANAVPRIGLLGLGTWGRNYLRNLASLGALNAVCDANETAVAAASRDYPQARVCRSVDELLGLDDLDAVVVALPTPQHHAAAKQVLEAGKHCLVEKPLCDNADAALELCELAESKGLALVVGHILLYSPAVEYIRGMIEGGELGEIYYISCTRTNLGAIRTSENAMWSLAPHDISIVQYLFDAAPQRVSATGRAFIQREQGIEDMTTLTLDFADGRIATITSSWLDPEKTRLIKVVGSERMVVFDDMDPRYQLQIHDKSVDWSAIGGDPSTSFLKVRSGEVRIPVVKPTEPLRAQCAEFIRSIQTGEPARSSGRQGYANVRILASAASSLRSGGAPVETGL
jgi:predicted dehydrogenase